MLIVTIAGALLSLSAVASGRLVKVDVSDTSAGGIHFSNNWFWPIHFDWNGDDVRGVGGPNSSVCEMDVSSRLSVGDGDSFNFAFRGVSVQLVFSSRPDHSPFSVEYDGQTSFGDTYSQIVHCGAAWSSPTETVIRDHNLTCTNHVDRERVYLELLSILYDDGIDQPSSSSASESPTSGVLPADRGAAHDLGPGAVAGIAIGSVGLVLCILLVAFLSWRRKQRGAARVHQDATVYPLPASTPGSDTGGRKSLSPTRRAHVLPALPASGESVQQTPVRLADADVDRIAVRMHEVLDARVLHHAPVGSDLGGHASSLPPYWGIR